MIKKVMRKYNIFFFLIFAYYLVFQSGYAFGQVDAEATYVVMEQGLKSVTIEVSGSNLLEPTIVLVPLPIRTILKPSSQTGVLGITHREKYSILLFLLEPNRLSEHLVVEVDPEQTVENGVRISQTPLGTALIIPRITKQISDDLDLFTRVKGALSVSSYSRINATFSKGFELYSGTGGTTITKLDQKKTVPLSLDPRGQHYYQFFRAPSSYMVEYIEKGIVRLIAVILGLFLAFMAPGFIAPQYFNRVILITIVFLIFVLIVRWWIAGPSKNSIISAISDTIAIVVSMIGLGVVWFLRRLPTNSGSQSSGSQDGS